MTPRCDRCGRDQNEELKVSLSMGRVLCQPCQRITTDPRLMPHWTAMVETAEKIGWPKAFRADLLVHDWDALCELEPEDSFLWALGECGTWLIFPNARQNPIATAAVARQDGHRLFWWNGKTLREVLSLREADHKLGVAKKAAWR